MASDVQDQFNHRGHGGMHRGTQEFLSGAWISGGLCMAPRAWLQFHSLRKLFTGLAIEALIVWKLIAMNAIANTNTPAIKNVVAVMLILCA